MAGKKITQLPAAAPPVAAASLLAVVQNGTTVRAAINQLGFQSPASGSVARTITSKLQDFVSPKDFGAVGDGVADDTAALQLALNSGSAIFDSGNNVYRTTSALTFNGSSLKIFGRLRIVGTQSSGTILTLSGTAKTATYLGADTRTARTTISVNSAANIAVGDILYIRDVGRVWPYGATAYPTFNYGETQFVRALSGTTVSPADAMYLSYTASTDVTITPYTPCVVDIDGLEIFSASGTAACFGITALANSIIKNSTFNANGHTVGVSAARCFGVSLNNCLFLNASDAGTGYGIQWNDSTSCHVKDSRGYNNRRMVDISGAIPSHNCGITGCYVSGIAGTGSGIGSHSTANKSFFVGNVIANSQIGIQCRGPNNTITGNQISNVSTGIVLAGAPGAVISGNSMFRDAVPSGSDNNYSSFLDITTIEGENNDTYLLGPQSQVSVVGNVSTNSGTFIQTAVNGKFLNVQDNVVVLRTNSGGNPTSFMNSNSAKTLDNTCVITNNRAINSFGTYQRYRNVLVDSSISDWATLAETNIGTGTRIVVKDSGAGTLDSVTYNFGYYTRDPSGRMMRLRAGIEFVISGGSAAIKWDGLEIGPETSQVVYRAVETGGAPCSVGFTSSNSDSLFIGNDAADPTVAWGAGTYTVEFDIEWAYRYNTLG